MDDITQIRSTFDKGNVGVFADKISVVFTATENCWVYQSIANNLSYKSGNQYKLVLEKLIAQSKSVSISVLPIGKFRLDFKFSNPDRDAESIWFLPLSNNDCGFSDTDMSGNPEIAREIQNKFSEVFRSVDTDDEEAMLEATSEWLSYLNQSDRGFPKPIDSIKQWQKLKQICVRFYRKKPLGILDIQDPDLSYTDGCAEFQLDSTQAVTHTIEEELKGLFLDMVRFSETVHFEVGQNGDTTIANLDFYV